MRFWAYSKILNSSYVIHAAYLDVEISAERARVALYISSLFRIWRNAIWIYHDSRYMLYIILQSDTPIPNYVSATVNESCISQNPHRAEYFLAGYVTGELAI